MSILMDLKSFTLVTCTESCWSNPEAIVVNISHAKDRSRLRANRKK